MASYVASFIERLLFFWGANCECISGNGIPVLSKPAGGPTAGLGPQVVQNADVLVKQATSSSSREQSDDDEMEGEAETTGNANPVQQRLQRR